VFFKRNKKIKKSVALYISTVHNQIIVCPRFVNNAGIIYEQEICTLLDFSQDATTIGNEVLRNFNLFALKDKNLRDLKRTDWPAFKCSKLKTIKSFEESFLFIDIAGNNESNIILSNEAPMARHDNMFITSNISSSPSNKQEIGQRIMQVYNIAIAKSF